MQDQDFTNELARCLSCKKEPCSTGCPLGLSPCDFIKAARTKDYKTAALLIAKKNPLPQTCGLICPGRFCQKKCTLAFKGAPIKIPCLQAEIIRRGGYPETHFPPLTGQTAAIVGGGAAGLAAADTLVKNGWQVTLFEQSSSLGGAARLIPEYRLPSAVLDAEIARIVNNDRITVRLQTKITDFAALKQEYDGVILALGETSPRKLGILGEEHCLPYAAFLSSKKDVPAAPALGYPLKEPQPKAAVIGGGEVALDCALTACRLGYAVEMFVRRRKEDMRIEKDEHTALENAGVLIRELTSVTAISCPPEKPYCLTTVKNNITDNNTAAPILTSETKLSGYSLIISALGSFFPKEDLPEGFIAAGDMTKESGTIAEALASGIAAANQLLLKTKGK